MCLTAAAPDDDEVPAENPPQPEDAGDAGADSTTETPDPEAAE